MNLRIKTAYRDELIGFNGSDFELEELKDTLDLMYSKKLILNGDEYCMLMLIKDECDKLGVQHTYTLCNILTAEISRKIHYSRISQKWHNNKHNSKEVIT